MFRDQVSQASAEFNPDQLECFQQISCWISSLATYDCIGESQGRDIQQEINAVRMSLQPVELIEMFEIFQGKRVLLTGHTGFKGSWLSLWLDMLGAEVHGFSKDIPTDPSLFQVADVSSVLKSHTIGDLRNLSDIENVFQIAQPEIVLHLAAQTVVATGYEDPLETYSSNVMGTANLLDVVRRRGESSSVLVVSTDKCYQNDGQHWGFRENDPLGEKDPYGSSKSAAELVVKSYRESYFLPEDFSSHGVALASARAGNVIGGGDWTETALVVDLMKALSEGQDVELRRPNAFRPWQHVLQCLSGYLNVAAGLEICRQAGQDLSSRCPLKRLSPREICSAWNIGPTPGSELPVKDLVKLFIKHWGSGSWVDRSEESSMREAIMLRLSIDRAISLLGWRPLWDVEQTVEKTVQWYKSFQQSPETIQEVTRSQIRQYQQDFSDAFLTV